MNNQPFNDFNNNSSQNSFSDNQHYTESQNSEVTEVKTFSPSLTAKKKKMQKLFIILLIIGLCLGAIISVGIVILLNEFGLTDNAPNPFNQINREQVDQ